jgi:hypothetical protein
MTPFIDECSPWPARHEQWAITAETIEANEEVLHGELRAAAASVAHDLAKTAAEGAGLGADTYRGKCWREGAKHAYADALESALFFMPLSAWRKFAHALNNADRDRSGS